MARHYRVFYKKVPAENSSDYFLNHSSYVYLIGPNGQYVTLFSSDQMDRPDEVAARLREDCWGVHRRSAPRALPDVI